MSQIDIKKRFGFAVRTIRHQLAISQEELAERAGLHRTYISDVERGARNISLESMEKLANGLQVSLWNLVTQIDQESCASTNAAASSQMAEILFVEDNADDVALTLHTLKQSKISNRIQTVSDGAEALEYLFCIGRYASRRPGEGPQIILLDLDLPKVSGLEVLRRIKADPRTRNIPVAVLTASRHDKDIQASKRLGAEAYIVKPVDFQNLSQVTPQLSFHWALLKQVSALNG